MREGKYEDWQITALGHDGFIIESQSKKLRIAFDPFDISGEFEPVNYVLVSHSHYDHCDPTSIRKLSSAKTKIIAPRSCKEELATIDSQIELIDDKEKHEDGQLTYWAVPAYNINKFRTPNEVFHPKDLGGVGWVVEIDRTRFYHAGDTDKIPEMENLKKIDVAFLPISGTFVMTLEEALEAAEVIHPKLVIPMHFGKLLGSVSDAFRFQNLLKEKEQPVLALFTHAD